FEPKIKKTPPRALLSQWRESYGGSKALDEAAAGAVFYKTMEEFFNDLTLGRDSDIQRRRDYKASRGAVELMTLHAAKGLEFPVVFVAGVNYGLLPLVREEDSVDVQEERRLFYVGLTRAKEELIITWSGQGSPFVQELPENMELRQITAVKKEQTLFPDF
ncbi:MAG: 3'-5' exonuclease, partial [Bacillota bacterium]|nr:3'-5' exonuclease [Bacillota bacterium]